MSKFCYKILKILFYQRSSNFEKIVLNEKFLEIEKKFSQIFFIKRKNKKTFFLRNKIFMMNLFSY